MTHQLIEITDTLNTDNGTLTFDPQRSTSEDIELALTEWFPEAPDTVTNCITDLATALTIGAQPIHDLEDMLGVTVTYHAA